MADIILQAVIRKAVDIASNLVIQEASSLSRVKGGIEWIEQEMRYIQSYIEDADAKQGENKAVAALVSDIIGLGLDVEDIMDTYFPKIASPKRKGFFGGLRSAFGFFGYVYASHNFAAEIEGIRARVNEINRRRQTYGIQEKSGNREGDIWDARRSFPHVNEPNVVGFKEHIKKLVAIVLDRDSGIISITGMAGLGKTTLARKVYNYVLQSFKYSAWICVSQHPNIAELLCDVARQVGLEKEKWKHDVEVNLFSFLRDKRYVIVVDDLWETKSWDALMRGIPNNSESGSKIILTSRNREVGVHVGLRSSLHELQPLDPKNSRNLFFNMVRGPLENMKETSCDPPELRNIGKQILKRCGGVPLAIVLTAGMLLLKERTEYAWKGVLGRMGQEKDDCSEIFGLSYKDLPTKLKPCFLYFGIFPEDYEIPAFDLINLWAAEGFIQANGMREVEDVGEDYLNHLFARNLIQVARRKFDGRIKSLRIHDILHSFCVMEAKEINFFNTHNEPTIVNSALRVRRVTTNHNNPRECISFFSNYRSPKLRAMLIFCRDDYWGVKIRMQSVFRFLRDLRFLRSLSLEFQLNLEIVSSFTWFYLPSEIGNLSHLIYLRLKVSGGHFELPSTISNLRNLLTLDARGSEFLKIPDCIWRMKHLRHILLPRDYSIKSSFGKRLLFNMDKFYHPIEKKASFVNLQTLFGLISWHLPRIFSKHSNLRKLGICFLPDDWSKVEELLDAITVSHKLEILRLDGRYDRIENQFDIVYFNLSRYENLFRLHLENFKVELPEHDKLPENLTKLTLKETWLEEDPMETLKKLPKLKILKLGYDSYEGKKLMVCSGGGRGPSDYNFPLLQVLELDRLFKLNELIVEEEGVMPQIKKLRMTRCPAIHTTRVPDRIKNIMTTY